MRGVLNLEQKTDVMTTTDLGRVNLQHMYTRLDINLLLTEREGRSGEYWPKLVAVRTERSEVRTKRPRANIPRYGSS